MTTDLETEREAQRAWRLRAEASSGAPFLNQLLENEFADPNVHTAALGTAIAAIVGYAVRNIPYYQNLFAQHDILADQIRTSESLVDIPTLSRDALRQNFNILRPRALPIGERLGGKSVSSGTTGQQIVVEQTVRNRSIFGLLKQREYRWFRYDPMGTQFWIRRASSTPRRENGSQVSSGEVAQFDSWPVLGSYVETGPCHVATIENPPDWLAEQLIRVDPQSLMATNARLEHLAFALRDGTRPSNLTTAQALTGVLTPEMRRQIETTLDIQVYQNYGLNEVGIVASQCEERRYHIHTEHCWAEIADEDGHPTAPGEVGRVLVTALGNAAMPLIRYETGDLARATVGPCPCGRTLPTIGRIIGRRSRIEHLPAGTQDLSARLLAAMASLPVEISGSMREYQLHQFKPGDYELRVVMAGSDEPEFEAHLLSLWSEFAKQSTAQLTVRSVPNLALSPSGKFMHFTSEHISPEDGILKTP